MNSKNRGLIMIGLSAACYGFEPIFAKLCFATGFSVSNLLLTRFLLAAIGLLIYGLITRQPLILPGKYLKVGIIMGLIMSLNIALLFKAFELLPSAVAILFFYIYPSLTSIWAKLLNNVPIAKIRILAISICLFGVVLLYWGSFELRVNVLGILYAVLSAVLMSYLIMLLEKYMPEVNKISYNLTIFYVAIVSYLAWSLINQDIFVLGQIEPTGILYLLLLVLLPTLASNFLMCYGMNTAPAVDASILNIIETPCAAIYAYIIFGDVLAGWQIVGAILIMIAAVTPSVVDKFKEKRENQKELST